VLVTAADDAEAAAVPEPEAVELPGAATLVAEPVARTEALAVATELG
jgi:hypothetical protein